MGLDIYSTDLSVFNRNAYYATKIECFREIPPYEQAYRHNYLADSGYYLVSADIPSNVNPNHYCNRNYLHSSYNDAGYNSKVEHFQMMNIFDILEPITNQCSEDEDGYITPSTKAIEESLVLAKQAVLEWQELISSGPLYDYTLVSSGYNKESMGQLEAFDKVKEILSSDTAPTEPTHYFDKLILPVGQKDLDIVAIMPNVKRYYINETCTMVVYAAKEEDIQSYYELSQIIVEFLEELLLMGEPRLVISG